MSSVRSVYKADVLSSDNENTIPAQAGLSQEGRAKRHLSRFGCCGRHKSKCELLAAVELTRNVESFGQEAAGCLAHPGGARETLAEQSSIRLDWTSIGLPLDLPAVPCGPGRPCDAGRRTKGRFLRVLGKSGLSDKPGLTLVVLLESYWSPIGVPLRSCRPMWPGCRVREFLSDRKPCLLKQGFAYSSISTVRIFVAPHSARI